MNITSESVVAYTSRYDIVLFVSYSWDAHPVDAPIARIESLCIQMARVWLEHVGVERFGNWQPFAKDHTLADSSSFIE